MNTPISFVRGEAMRLYKSRAGFTDIELARRVYGAERAESQRKRIKAMCDREITTLGTRGMSAEEEAQALAKAFGHSDVELLASALVYSLFDRAGAGGKVVAPGGGAMSFGDQTVASAVAHRIGESGLFERPLVFPITEREMLIHGFGPTWNWLNERRSREVPMTTVDWLLDLERLERGGRVRSRRFLAEAPMHLDHLGWMLVRLREARDIGVTEDAREDAGRRLRVVAGLLRDIGEHYVNADA